MRIKKNELITALKNIKPFTNKSMPITECVLIDGPGQRIVATDLSTWAEVAVDIIDFTHCSDNEMTEIQELFCVDPIKLLQIVKSLELKGDDFIEFSIDEIEYEESFETVSVRSLSIGGHFQSIQVLGGEQFPVSSLKQENINQPYADVELSKLKNMTKVLVEKDHAYRHVMLFDPEKQEFVTCDGKRIHLHKLEIIHDKKLSLPTAMLKKFCSFSKSDSEIEKVKIKTTVDADCVELNFKNITVTTTNCIEDVNFPEYADIIEEQYNPERTIVVNKDALKSVITQALVIADISITMEFNGGINIQTTGETGEYNRENIPFVEGSIDPPIKIKFPPQFVIDALYSGNEENVEISIMDNQSPVYFKTPEENFIALVMPMHQ